MMFGLTKKDIDYIIKVIQGYSGIEKAVIFGSRAQGNYKKISDIDIALFGRGIEAQTLSISGILNDQSPFPYQVDIVDYASINNKKLKDHIDSVGIQIYPNA